jgi:hypothetical protein
VCADVRGRPPVVARVAARRLPPRGAKRHQRSRDLAQPKIGQLYS